MADRITVAHVPPFDTVTEDRLAAGYREKEQEPVTRERPPGAPANTPDIDTICERHTPYTKETYHGAVEECSACFDGWPCDTRVVLDALDAKPHRNADICTLEKAVLEGHAKALAEALRETGECWCPAADDPARDDKCIRCAALAAYDKDHER